MSKHLGERITIDSKAVSGGELHRLALLVDGKEPSMVPQTIERNTKKLTTKRRLILENGETCSSSNRADYTELITILKTIDKDFARNTIVKLLENVMQREHED